MCNRYFVMSLWPQVTLCNTCQSKSMCGNTKPLTALYEFSNMQSGKSCVMWKMSSLPIRIILAACWCQMQRVSARTGWVHPIYEIYNVQFMHQNIIQCNWEKQSDTKQMRINALHPMHRAPLKHKYGFQLAWGPDCKLTLPVGQLIFYMHG